MPKPTRVPVYVEAGAKRTFACATGWPGWCRAARTEDDAVQALAVYAPRYARVAARAGLALREPIELEVVERLSGTATTDFGAPDRALDSDSRPLPKAERERLLALMRAAWDEFDETVARSPAELRPGPRGGGRNRDRIVEHVLGAESAYARKLGVRVAQPDVGDAAAVESMRSAISDACGSATTSGRWPVRYFVRRLVWHALDHTWEMEDRRV